LAPSRLADWPAGDRKIGGSAARAEEEGEARLEAQRTLS